MANKIAQSISYSAINLPIFLYHINQRNNGATRHFKSFSNNSHHGVYSGKPRHNSTFFVGG